MHSHRQTKQLKSPHKEKQLNAFPQTDKTANKIVKSIVIKRKKTASKNIQECSHRQTKKLFKQLKAFPRTDKTATQTVESVPTDRQNNNQVQQTDRLVIGQSLST